MKLHRIYLTVILLLAFSVGISGRGPPKAVLVDEFGVLCSEDLMGRYDAFLSQISANKPGKGLVIFYGDESSEGRNISLYRYIADWYPEVRQFKNKIRLEFVRGANQAGTKIQFWLVPDGAKEPTPIELYSPSPVKSTVRYDVAGADFHKVKGKTYLYFDGFSDLGCDFGANNIGFVEHLRSNVSLTGYLVVYTEFGKGKDYGDRVAKFALNELLKNFKISRTRVKALYGGNRKSPEIELWLVPNGDNLPIIRPDVKPTSP